MHFVARDGLLEAITVEEIKDSTSRDQEMKILMNAVTSRRKDFLTPELHQFNRVFKSLSVVDGIILKANKIVIPKKLRKRIVTAGHEGHQGFEKTKQLLRSKVWYPGIDNEAMIAKQQLTSKPGSHLL